MGCNLYGSVFAKSFVESIEQGQVNWTASKLDYVGIGSSLQEEKNYVQAVERAKINAKEFISDYISNLCEANVKDLLKSDVEVSNSCKQLINIAILKQRTTKTEYSSNGDVQVHYRLSLKEVFQAMPYKYTPIERSGSEGTGIVFQVDNIQKALKPFFQLVDTKGNLLLSFENFDRKTLAVSLTAHWILGSEDSKLEEWVGKKPVQIRAVSNQKGQLVVDANEWSKVVTLTGQNIAKGRILISDRSIQ